MNLLNHVPNAEGVILGVFNVHSNNWLTYSSIHIDAAGLEAESFAITNNLAQLFADPTRIPD